MDKIMDTLSSMSAMAAAKDNDHQARKNVAANVFWN